MRLPRPKLVQRAFAITLLLASALYVGSILVRPKIEDRVYVIGFEHVPPFQQKSEDGSPTGLAVDLVRDAAQRRGIRLKWVWHTGSSEAALRNRDVDLWPLVTITPERQREKAIHISKPYVQHDHNLLVLRASPYFQVQDMGSASVSYRRLPIHRQLLQRILPNAPFTEVDTQKDAIENVCAGRTDSAFVDEFTANATLLSGISCQSQPLRIIALPMLRSQLGVGSTLAASAVADEIRSEIDASALEEELVRVLKNGGNYSTRTVEYFSALLNAQRRERRLTIVAGIFAGLVVLMAVAADRIRRQRNRIEITGKALLESEQKLRLMANNLSVIVMAFDMKRRLVFANPAVEQLTGYSVADLETQTSIGWAHPDDRLRMHAYWDKLFEGRAFRDEEYRLITKDGRIRWMIASWGPAYDEGGEQVGIQGSERDITERKLTEQALGESERRFRELLENVHLVAIMTDSNGAITFCNDRALALTGWHRDEVIGRPVQELIDSGVAVQAPGEKSFALPGGLVQPYFEGSILEKNGGRRCIQWSNTMLRAEAGRAIGFASLGEDVTELRDLRAKAAQHESDERFRNTADTSPLMIWLSGPDKSCTFVNKGWLTFTGRALDQELGSGWITNVHPDDREYWLSTYTSAFDSRHDFQMEYRQRRADGECRWILGSGITRYGVDGDFAGYVGTCTDITDLKRIRDNDIARQKLENVGRLAGGIAHDFNNLLGGVLAQADLGIAQLQDHESPREQLITIRNVAVRGAAIVRQLMIYAGQESTVAEQVDISHLIDDMLDLLKVVISKHPVLTIELARGLPAILANSAELRQVLMNLVTNASEAIGEREGVIAIRTAEVNAGPDSPTGNAKAYVLLEVSDSGSGIDPDAQHKLFEPFFTTKSSGKGLGLAVVQGIVQRLSGSIQVETERGRGSTFRVLLPAALGVTSATAAVERAPFAEELIAAGTVLIVEDEDPIRAAATKCLRSASLSVMAAADGTAAVDLLRRHDDAIRVVLLDITLPGTPSREVFAEARRIRPEMKVIITSAYGPQKADECFPGMAIDAFIRKPYRLEELVTLVQRFVSAERTPIIGKAASP